MKKSIMFVICLSIFMLSACGDDYDDEIDEVIKLENVQLDKPNTDTNIDKLIRDDTEIRVYEDGKYIELQYTIRPSKTTSTLYKVSEDGGEYVNEYNGDFNYKSVDGKVPDYTENVDDNS